jgi:hypothetical protein
MVAEVLDTAWVAWATDVAGKQEADKASRKGIIQGDPAPRFGVNALRLLERDFTHGFCAEDFADVESFHSSGAALVFRAHDLLDDRVHLIA